MATLDLRPISQETIEQIGLKDNDLWLVKIGEDNFGPFETQSLKQYASENQTQFDEALATRMDNIDYKPFWENPLFQRRQLQPLSDKHEGPFWLLKEGVLKGPYSFNDIDKKIETGLLVLTDHISTDEGSNWKKICEISGFDRRTHSAEELPILPTEAIFDKGKISLVEKLETSHSTAIDQLAELAHVGAQEAKVIQFKSEEVAAQIPTQIAVSPSLNWAIPAAVAFVLTLGTSGYFMMSSSEEPQVVAETEAPVGENFYQRPMRQRPRQMPQGVMPEARRMPASASYSQRPVEEVQHESRYPTHVETHDRPYEEVLTERDSENVQNEDQKMPAEEHSLVAGNAPNQPAGSAEENSLDAAMNGTEQQAPEAQEKAVVEEASDF